MLSNTPGALPLVSAAHERSVPQLLARELSIKSRQPPDKVWLVGWFNPGNVYVYKLTSRNRALFSFEAVKESLCTGLVRARVCVRVGVGVGVCAAV